MQLLSSGPQVGVRFSPTNFTHHNVRRAVTGIARYVAGKRSGWRTWSSSPAIPVIWVRLSLRIAASVLAAHSITPLVVPEAAPTPAISYAITHLKADGAINFTASHNPAEYNGVKFNSSDGAPSLPEGDESHRSRDRVKADAEADKQPAASGKRAAEHIDIKPAYLKRLKEIVDLKRDRQVRHQGHLRSALGRGAAAYSDVLLREASVSRRHSPRCSRCALRRACA